MVSGNVVIHSQNRPMSKVFGQTDVSIPTVTGLTLIRSCFIFFDLETSSRIRATRVILIGLGTTFHAACTGISYTFERRCSFNGFTVQMTAFHGKPGQFGIGRVTTREDPDLEYP